MNSELQFICFLIYQIVEVDTINFKPSIQNAKTIKKTHYPQKVC